MAHTYDLATAIGRVRLRIADTRQETAFFVDAQIQAALDEAGTEEGAANYLQRVLALGNAAKGDVERARVLMETLALTGGDMPTVTVGEGNALPTDDAYVWP